MFSGRWAISKCLATYPLTTGMLLDEFRIFTENKTLTVQHRIDQLTATKRRPQGLGDGGAKLRKALFMSFVAPGMGTVRLAIS